MTGPRTQFDVPCLFCGALCDDLQLTVEGNSVKQVEGGCGYGQSQLLAASGSSALETQNMAMAGGVFVGMDQALERAANLLTEAKRPLLFGLTYLSCQAQQAALHLARRLRATVLLHQSPLEQTWNRALQSDSQVSCSFGEIEQRADQILIWGARLNQQQQFLLKRLTCSASVPVRQITILHHQGMCYEESRSEKKQALNQTLAELKQLLGTNVQIKLREIPAGSDGIALTVMRAILTDSPLCTEEVFKQTGHSFESWKQLCQQLQQAEYGLFLWGEALAQDPSSQVMLAAAKLIRQLNETARFSSLPISAGGNQIGAEQVLTWQTGNTASVDFASADHEQGTLVSEKVTDFDAVFVVGTPYALLEQSLKSQIAKVDHILLETIPAALLPTDHQKIVPVKMSQVTGDQITGNQIRLTAAPYGLAEQGTIYRMDGIPLDAKPILTSDYPNSQTWLTRLTEVVENIN